MVYAFLRSLEAEPAPAEADGHPSGPVRFEVLLDPSRIADGKIIATLAARARIRELEESPEWTTARGSRQQDRKATGVSKEIIELSTRYGVISRETSFVAIERRETPVLGIRSFDGYRLPLLQDGVVWSARRPSRACPARRCWIRKRCFSARTARPPAFARRMSFGAAGETGFLNKLKRLSGFGGDDDDDDVAELRDAAARRAVGPSQRLG